MISRAEAIQQGLAGCSFFLLINGQAAAEVNALFQFSGQTVLLVMIGCCRHCLRNLNIGCDFTEESRGLDLPFHYISAFPLS